DHYLQSVRHAMYCPSITLSVGAGYLDAIGRHNTDRILFCVRFSADYSVKNGILSERRGHTMYCPSLTLFVASRYLEAIDRNNADLILFCVRFSADYSVKNSMLSERSEFHAV